MNISNGGGAVLTFGGARVEVLKLVSRLLEALLGLLYNAGRETSDKQIFGLKERCYTFFLSMRSYSSHFVHILIKKKTLSHLGMAPTDQTLN